MGSGSAFRSGSGLSSILGGSELKVSVPVLVKAPDFSKNSVRTTIPFLLPSRVGRSRCLEPLVRISRCWLYLGHSLRMWLLDSLAELSHGQVVGSVERGRKVWRNSPVYECPVRHWINRPNSSRLLLRFRKWLVGVSDGLSLLAMAK